MKRALSTPSGSGGRVRFDERGRTEATAYDLARILRRFSFISFLLLAAVALGYCGWSLHRFIYHSDYFKIREIRFTEASEELKRDARTLLDKRFAQTGDNLLEQNPVFLTSQLGRLPRAKSVQVSKIYPGTLQVEFMERTPLVVAQLDNHYFMDEEGVLLEQITPTQMRQSGLPILTGLSPAQPTQAGELIEYERLGEILQAVNYINRYEPFLKKLIVEWNVNSKTGITAVLNTHCDVQFGMQPPMEVLDKLIAGLEMEKDLENKKTIDLRFDPKLIYEDR